MPVHACPVITSVAAGASYPARGAYQADVVVRAGGVGADVGPVLDRAKAMALAGHEPTEHVTKSHTYRWMHLGVSEQLVCSNREHATNAWRG